ncbi:sulfite exporter TauE/SafE family protein [Clostridium cavendishii]|uniref:sulfite exporter TauE/SafE family protein n=1 Tax=Clostridium cavendishii TaxID=349931 RepID=UPI001FA937FE|nr:sulfite exporter TauE/SafE family protein [Clostridium cavendishii]
MVGFLVGLLIISLGGGGGGIYVGILTIFFNISPAIATSTSLATIIPTTAIGTFSHWKAGNIRIRFGLIMISGGVLGAIVGSLCSSVFPVNLYNKFTGIVILYLGIQMLRSLFKKRKKTTTEKQMQHKSNIYSNFLAVVFGLIGGIMSGIVGISGSIPVVAGLTILGCSVLETVGTSVMVLVGISITGFLMHLGLGSVDWKLVGLLSTGTMSGAFVAPLLLNRVDKKKLEKIIQPVLLIMTIAIGIALIFK